MLSSNIWYFHAVKSLFSANLAVHFPSDYFKFKKFSNWLVCWLVKKKKKKKKYLQKRKNNEIIPPVFVRV